MMEDGPDELGPLVYTPPPPPGWKRYVANALRIPFSYVASAVIHLSEWISEYADPIDPQPPAAY